MIPVYFYYSFNLKVFKNTAFSSLITSLTWWHVQEFLVKSGDRVELMAMLGVFGAIISACQMYP